jgi:hypothetical protein
LPPDINDPEVQERLWRLQEVVIESFERGEMTRERYLDALSVAVGMALYPDDPEEAKAHAAALVAFRDSGPGRALRRAIEQAVALEGVEIPIGSADGPEAN